MYLLRKKQELIILKLPCLIKGCFCYENVKTILNTFIQTRITVTEADAVQVFILSKWDTYDKLNLAF